MEIVNYLVNGNLRTEIGLTVIEIDLLILKEQIRGEFRFIGRGEERKKECFIECENGGNNLEPPFFSVKKESLERLTREGIFIEPAVYNADFGRLFYIIK